MFSIFIKIIIIIKYKPVTVSIGDERKGVLRVIFLVSFESIETSDDGKLINPGKIKRSS